MRVGADSVHLVSVAGQLARSPRTSLTVSCSALVKTLEKVKRLFELTVQEVH